jgi:hypothetical protein
MFDDLVLFMCVYFLVPSIPMQLVEVHEKSVLVMNSLVLRRDEGLLDMVIRRPSDCLLHFQVFKLHLDALCIGRREALFLHRFVHELHTVGELHCFR